MNLTARSNTHAHVHTHCLSGTPDTPTLQLPHFCVLPTVNIHARTIIMQNNGGLVVVVDGSMWKKSKKRVPAEGDECLPPGARSEMNAQCQG
jgi:hypothetical protein